MTSQTVEPVRTRTAALAEADEAARLLAEAQRAARLRAYQTDPAVVALVVERTRVAIERTMWIGIGLGMAFTTVSVQQWGATGVELFGLGWWAAWLLAPLVEVPLLAILRGESTAARYGVTVGPWVKRARWTLLTAAYLMNTLGPWTALITGGSFAEVLRHSVPVVAVLVGVEALTDVRVALNSAVTAAVAAASAASKTAPKAAAPARPRPTRGRAQPTPSDPSAEAPLPDAVVDGSDPAPPDDLTAARTARQVGVDWAVEHWRDDLRPVDIGAAMVELGRPVSKGERSS